jgi:inner membrane protein
MDNLCHTLVGAALGEAGLKRTTRFANATLMISANLPDIDVLVFATGTPSVAFRRGWTHGVLAQVLLPIVLTAIVAAVARLRPVVRRTGAIADPSDGPALSLIWLLVLSYIGVYSHVFLDYLNNYGVRLLAPLNWRWFYGDAVFIVDVWLWLALGAGVWLARRRGSVAPARGSLLFAGAYIVVMLMSARAARAVVVDTWRSARGAEPSALMVGPVFVSPFTRDVVVDAGDRYETGSFSWRTASVTFDARTVAKNSDAPEVAVAREAANVRAFLVWSRFPFWELQHSADGTLVTVRDMRFADRFAASTIVATKTN